MAHKDWDGPGWYDKFTKTSKQYVGSGNYTSDYLSDEHMYTPRESPRKPKEGLADGLYLLVGKNSGSLYLAIKCGDVFRDETNTVVDLRKYTVTNRIPTEPI